MRVSSIFQTIASVTAVAANLAFDLSVLRAHVQPVTKEARLSVTISNLGPETIDVALSFNQTFSTDATAIPPTGGTAARSQIRKTNDWSSISSLFSRSATLPKALLVTLSATTPEVGSRSSFVIDCLGRHGPTCSFDQWRPSSSCFPKVKLLRHLRLAVLDYAPVLQSCSETDIRDDLTFLQTLLGVEAVELDELEAIDDPFEKLNASDFDLNTVKAAQTGRDLSLRPSDPLSQSQWALHTGSVWRAWLEIGPGPTHYKPRVGVVDSGIWQEHPDLEGNVFVNQAELYGRPGVDDDGNGFVDDIYGWAIEVGGASKLTDISGHGTHVTGTVGALTNNSLGVASVAGPNVDLLACRRNQPGGFGSVGMAAECNEWLVSLGAQISSNSYGMAFNEHQTPSAWQIRFFETMEAAGVLFVISAGNEGRSFGPPHANIFTADCCYNWPNQICVANLDPVNLLNPGSNYGENCASIAAPGTNILATTDPSHVRVDYGMYTGTSMAAPFVAGVGAIWLNVNPYLDPYELKRLFREAIVRLPSVARPVTLFGGIPDPAAGVRLLRPELLRPADGSNWDRNRFILRRLAPGTSTTYELTGLIPNFDGAYLGDMVAYSVDLHRNYKVLEKRTAPVYVQYIDGDFEPTSAPALTGSTDSSPIHSTSGCTTSLRTLTLPVALLWAINICR